MPSQVGTTYGTRFQFQGTGIVLYAGTGSPEGVVVGNVGDIYFRKDCSGTVPSIYSKLSGDGTITGWSATAGAGAVPDAVFRPSTAVMAVAGGQVGLPSGSLTLTGNQPSVRLALFFAPASASVGVTGNQQAIPTIA